MLNSWIIFIVIALVISLAVFWPLKNRPLLFIACILSCSLVALSLYWYLGGMQQVDAYYVEQQKARQVKKMLKHFKNTQEIIVAMKNAIAKNPNKAKGWFLLGRLYRAQKNPTEAVSAFRKAYELEPNRLAYTFEYLQCLYAINNQQHTPEITHLIHQLKTKWPDKIGSSPELLDFLGYDAYIHGNYQSAIRYWEKLLPYLSETPKAHEAILLAIGKAEKKLVK